MSDKGSGPDEPYSGTDAASIASDELDKDAFDAHNPILDQVEPLEQYRPGGFIPLNPGDSLDKGRFLVLQKLGFGRTATVWLCQENETGKWVAIKVYSDEASDNAAREVQATRILRHASTGSQGEGGIGRLALATEFFYVKSANGRHVCGVLPVLGPSIMDWRRYDIMGDVDRTMGLCRQATEGMEYIHSKGICHGDFRPQNILMKLRPGCLDDLNANDMWKLLGEPGKMRAPKVKGTSNRHMPEWIITPMSPHVLSKYATDDIGILDFGDAYTPPSTLKRHKGLGIPKALDIPGPYAAPEAAFHSPRLFGKESDVWALACTLLDVRRGVPLGGSTEDTIRNTEWLVGGPLPFPYRPAAERMLAEAKARRDNDSRESELAEETIASLSESERNALARTEEGRRLRTLMPPLQKVIDNAQRAQKRNFSYNDPLEVLVGKYMMDSERGLGAGIALKALKHPLPQEEVVSFVDLLRNVFKYFPEERFTAGEVLEHRWLGLGRGRKVSATLDKQSKDIPLLVWAAIIYLAMIISMFLTRRILVNVEHRAAEQWSGLVVACEQCS